MPQLQVTMHGEDVGVIARTYVLSETDGALILGSARISSLEVTARAFEVEERFSAS